MPIIMYVSSGSKFFVSPVTVIKVEIAFQARPESPRWQGLGLCLEISPDLNVAMHFFPSLFFFLPSSFSLFFLFSFSTVSGISFKAGDRSTRFFVCIVYHVSYRFSENIYRISSVSARFLRFSFALENHRKCSFILSSSLVWIIGIEN